MAKRRRIRIDPNKVFLSDIIRLNLLLSSLYLTAFEILKLAIIEGVKDYLIDQEEITDDEEQRLRRTFQNGLADLFIEEYKEQVSRYEKELGVRINNRGPRGLIPSCEWLKKKEILSEKDIDDIKAVRDHRNEIAHELPYFLIGEGFNIKFEHFQKMRHLIQKVDVYWARNDLLSDPTTLEEIDISEIPDEEIISTRVAMLDLITNTVVEYLNEIAQSKGTNQSDEGKNTT